MVTKLEKRVQRIEERLKRIEDAMELSPMIMSFDWKDFTERDKGILNFLLEKGREGASTTEIAEKLEFEEPETSGRTIVYTRLKRIERISKRLKGAPLVISERKRWYLNYDDFNFPEVKTDESRETDRELDGRSEESQ